MGNYRSFSIASARTSYHQFYVVETLWYVNECLASFDKRRRPKAVQGALMDDWGYDLHVLRIRENLLQDC
jgi:hypothetical protein